MSFPHPSAQAKSLRLVSAATALALGSTLSFNASAESLGIIHVDSTTIDDRFEAKREEPSNINVISGETVDESHADNIQQLLQSVPGITTNWGSGESLKIHLRGVENQGFMGEKPGVAVVIDGVPVFERTGKVNIDLDNIESIKVVKGGASYLFGDDALAGAVIITTKRGAKMAGVKASVEGGSFGRLKGLVRGGFAGDFGSGHLQLSHTEVDGYYEDSSSEADYANGKLQLYVGEMSDLTFGFELADRAKNSHGAVAGVTAAANDPQSEDPTYNDYANHFDVQLQKYFLTFASDFEDESNLMLNVYQFSDDTKYNSAPVDSTEDDYGYTNDYSQVQRGFKAEYRHPDERAAWMIGTDLRANSYDALVNYLDCADIGSYTNCASAGIGGVHSTSDTSEGVYAFYGELKVRPAKRLTLTMNGRADLIDLEGTRSEWASAGWPPAYAWTTETDDKQFEVGSWRLGGNFAVTDNLDLYANGSTGFRAPTVKQLFIGISSPTMRTNPNPDLDPEQALNLEIGLRGKLDALGSLEYDLALFQIEREDFIEASNGRYTTGLTNQFENVGNARHRGVELSINAQPAKWISWDLAYTYLNAEYTDYEDYVLSVMDTNGFAPGGCIDGTWTNVSFSGQNYCQKALDNTGNDISRTPNHHLNLILAFYPTENLTISGEFDSTSSYFADELNQLEMDGHSTFNLLGNYDRKFGSTKLSIFGRVDNLFDEEYYNTARADNDDNEDGVYDEEDISLVVNQGITVSAGLSLTF
ncbi:TonB-dependent receptor [Candidatus Reidiella endopervernicosa]|uniref:TonB-dependent receptor n=1 Tax=Candidatus Reidiella endopervernicosa TaxID=2738883 RepID=A0A6N0HTW6_9GAMM|nr:TonB-dependent receptor [Candidatus Reidiella endopervernicosa]QKQ25760.1 TonB-dependent receptor [Candidatus Reidiella endopervernicosa]